MPALLVDSNPLSILREHFSLTEIKLHDDDADDRHERRYEPALLPIELRISAGGEHWTGLLADVSEGGARIIADRAPELERNITVSVATRGALLLLRGRVAHTGTENDVGFFGVEFNAPPVMLGNPATLATQRLSA